MTSAPWGVHSPIGLDIGARSVRAAQALLHKGVPTLHAHVVFARAEECADLSEHEARRIRRVLDRSGFMGVNVALSVPDEDLVSCAFEAPPAAPAARRAHARMEVARAANCSPQIVEAACWEVPSPARANERRHALALGCTHASAEKRCRPLEAAGLRPVVLEPRACALTRACLPQLASVPGIGTVVDLDWGGCTFILVYEGAVVYQRIDRGLGLSSWEADNPGCVEDLLYSATPDTSAEMTFGAIFPDRVRALCGELNLSLSYAVHRYPEASVGAVVLSGPGAEVPGLAAEFSRRLQLEVTVGCPGALARGAQAAPSVMAALGLSLHSAAPREVAA